MLTCNNKIPGFFSSALAAAAGAPAAAAGAPAAATGADEMAERSSSMF